jgi:aspartate carbamoyltransferase catalytic subunit
MLILAFIVLTGAFRKEKRAKSVARNLFFSKIFLVFFLHFLYTWHKNIPFAFFYMAAFHDIPSAQEIEKKLLATRNNRDLSCFDVVSIDDLSLEDITLILDLAEVFKQSKSQKLSLLKGVSIINAFYENSTRTRSSFELAGKHLGADTINITGSGSSITKGESLIDTAETLSALQPQVIVMRSQFSGVPAQLAGVIPASIASAGDGWHEHPSQALLDLKTITDHFNGDVKGKVVTMVGDILHSRVFGSHARLYKKLGITLQVACPKTFVPEKVEETFGVKIFSSVEDALPNADVVYALRVQEERGSKGYIPSLREYSKTFGINKKRLEMAKPHAILMHPGPVIRDIDVHSELVTLSSQSKILEQVENGMAVRAAILWLLADRKDKKIKEFVYK